MRARLKVKMRVKKACARACWPEHRSGSAAGFALEAAVAFGVERVAGFQVEAVAGFNWTRW